jgi:hypothetical protein
MMLDIYEKWNDMESKAATEGKSLYNRIPSTSFLIGWDPTLNVPFLQIEIKTTWTLKELKSYTTKGMDAHMSGKLLELKLKQVNQDGQFMKMCIEIIEKSRNGLKPDNATRTVLSDSANFFKSNKSGLGKNEQMGLYGELILLEKLLNHFPKKSLEVVNGWKGPTGSYHDFAYSDRSIEVKTTKKKIPEATIGSEKQLDRMKLTNLWLNAYSYVPDSGRDTLPKIISRIEKKLKGTAASRTFSRLLNIHCGRDEFDSYDTTYSESKHYWFEIKKGFPAITNKPKGIGNISYGLLLDQIEDKFKIEQNDVFKGLDL